MSRNDSWKEKLSALYIDNQARGVPAHQNWGEWPLLMALLEEYFSSAPRVVVEVGSLLGGAIEGWGMLLTVGGQMVSVDPTPPNDAQLLHLADTFKSRGISYHHIKGRLEDKVNELRKVGPIDFAFVDTSHDYESSKRQFDLIVPLLSARGVVAFHDIKMTYSLNTSGTFEKMNCKAVDTLWREIRDSGDYCTAEIVGNPNAFQGGGYGVVFMNPKKNKEVR